MSESVVRRDKAVLWSGCKAQEQPARLQIWEVGDLCRQLSIRTAIAYPMRKEVTNRVLLERKRQGRPRHPEWTPAAGNVHVGDKAALASGGIARCYLRCGLRMFFSVRPIVLSLARSTMVRRHHL